MSEFVYAIKNKLLPKNLEEGFIRCDPMSVTQEKLNFNKGVWLNRSYAEINTKYRQIIPYIVVTRKHGKELSYTYKTANKDVLLFKRLSKSELRLTNKTSIGIGGHINKIDNKKRITESGVDLVKAGAVRELCEEVNITPIGIKPRCLNLFRKRKNIYTELFNKYGSFIGYINDTSNNVGKVHLGVVFLLVLPEKFKITVREKDKLEGVMLDWDFVRRAQQYKWENWSKFLLDKLQL